MIGRLKIQGDKPWNMTITDAETGESLPPFCRVEYVCDLQTGKYSIKLWVHECDVDIDVAAPVEVIKVQEQAQ